MWKISTRSVAWTFPPRPRRCQSWKNWHMPRRKPWWMSWASQSRRGWPNPGDCACIRVDQILDLFMYNIYIYVHVCMMMYIEYTCAKSIFDILYQHILFTYGYWEPRVSLATAQSPFPSCWAGRKQSTLPCSTTKASSASPQSSPEWSGDIPVVFQRSPQSWDSSTNGWHQPQSDQHVLLFWILTSRHVPTVCMNNAWCV